MQTIKLAELTLNDEDFTTPVTMRMPRALALLLGRLGNKFFERNDENQFIPGADAHDICSVVERRAGLTNEDVAARATELQRAVKAAYDAYVELARAEGNAGTPVFRWVP